jgi:hypothetical protein
MTIPVELLVGALVLLGAWLFVKRGEAHDAQVDWQEMERRKRESRRRRQEEQRCRPVNWWIIF